MGRTYTCSMCERTLESEWTQEEAEAEKTTLWGDVSLDDCDVVCDDCFKVIGPEGSEELYFHFNEYHNPATKGKTNCTVADCGWRS